MASKWIPFKDYSLYKITLKNGKIIKFWTIGKELEKIFKDYNVPYEKCEDKRK